MFDYVCPISLLVNFLLCSIFDRSNSPLDEFGVKSGTFISEHRNVHHVRSRSCPAIACFLALMLNLERLSANSVQSTELDASLCKYRRVIVVIIPVVSHESYDHLPCNKIA